MPPVYSILYVDDEQHLLNIARIFLEKTGDFQVDITASASEALDSGKIPTYHAIVSDYMMPGMDGLAFLKTVREQYGDIPFILFTGRGREEVVIEAINSGVDFYLQKGGDAKAQFMELAHKIRMAISRRHAERSLVESEKLLADIINFLPDATFAIDREGHVIAWNRAIEEMTGVPAADILGKGDYEYSVPFYGVRRKILIDLIFEPNDEIAKHYANIIHNNDILIADTTLPRPKGMKVTLMGKASPLYNRQGKIVGAIESIRDISTLKQTEEELSRAKKDWEAIFRAVGHPAIILDNQNRIIEANNAAMEVTGKTLDELIGKHCYEVFHSPGSDKPPVSCPFEERKKSGNVQTAQTEIEALGGYYEMNCTPVYDAEGRIDKVIHIAMDVTERRRAEDNLKAAYEQLAASEEELRHQYDELGISERRIRESETRFRELADLLPEGIFEAATDGRIQYVNRMALEMSGYTSDDVERGVFALDVIAPEDRSRAAGVFSQILGEGTRPVGRAEYQAIKRDGRRFPVSIISSPIYKDGRITGIRGVITDITEQKNADEEIRAVNEQLAASAEELREQYHELVRKDQKVRESEKKFRELFNNLNDAVYIHEILPDSTPGRFLEVNDLMCSRLGFEREELLAMRIVDIISDEHRKKIDRIRSEISASGSCTFYAEHKRRDGSVFPVEVNSRILAFSGTRVVLAVARDITERAKAEQTLKESEEKYRTLVETTGTGLVIIDDKGRVLDANPEYVRLTDRRDLANIVGRNVLEWTAPYEKEKNSNAIRQCMQDGFIRNFEIDYVNSRGTIIPVEINATVLKTRGSTRIFTLCRDITERKRADAALRESEAKYRTVVEQSNDAIFIAQDGNLVFHNPAFAVLTGYDDSALEGRPITDLIAPEDREVVLARHKERLNGNLPPNIYEFSVLHRDGTRRIRVVMNVSAITFEGKPATLGTLHDVTRERNHEGALRP